METNISFTNISLSRTFNIYGKKNYKIIAKQKIKSNYSAVPIWCWNKPFVLIYEQTYLKSRMEVEFFFRDVNRSIAIQSPYMQIRIKHFDLNENAAKHLHLHLDHCKVTQLSHELYAT